MLIAHIDIVVKSEFQRRSDLSALADLPDDYIFPLDVAALFAELHEDAVEVLVDGMGYYGIQFL